MEKHMEIYSGMMAKPEVSLLGVGSMEVIGVLSIAGLYLFVYHSQLSVYAMKL